MLGGSISFRNHSKDIQDKILINIGTEMGIDLLEINSRLPKKLECKMDLWTTRKNKGSYINYRIMNAVNISKVASVYINNLVESLELDKSTVFFCLFPVCGY